MSAKAAARSIETATTWLRERHGLTDDDLLVVRAVSLRDGGWPGLAARARDPFCDEVAQDVAELRAASQRLSSRFAYAVGTDPPPVFGMLARLHEVIEEIARSQLPDIAALQRGETQSAERKREEVGFVRAYIDELAKRSGKKTGPSDAALVAIAHRFDPPVTGDVDRHGNDPWERRREAWRKALRRAHRGGD